MDIQDSTTPLHKNVIYQHSGSKSLLFAGEWYTYWRDVLTFSTEELFQGVPFGVDDE